MSTDEAEDYYIPTCDVTLYRWWTDDPAAAMYGRALEACWEEER